MTIATPTATSSARPTRSTGPAPDPPTDRAVGVAAGSLVSGAGAATLVAARGVSAATPWIILMAVVVGGATTWVGRRTFTPASRSPGRTTRRAIPGAPGRRRRRRVFGLTAAAAFAALTAALVLAGWMVFAALTGVLLGAGVTWYRLAGRSLRPSRPLRWLPVLLLIPLLPWAFSIESTLTAPGPDPLTIRSVEWVRGHGGTGIVNTVERWWYTLRPPPVGGTPRELTNRPVTTPAPAPLPTAAPDPGANRPAPETTVPALPAPATGLAPVVSPVPNPLPGEGAWTVTAGTPSEPAVATALVRPDAVHTGIVVGVLRIDPARARLTLVSGTEQPDGTSPSGGQVPDNLRSSLLAVFNAGFRMTEAKGGWYGEGRTAVPLRNGAASLVLRNDGRADVGVWGRDVSMGPNVTAVRQNLALLVDGGQVVPGTNSANNPLWGSTLGHKVLVSRSGVGVTADGALVYVGGPALSVETLARTLVAAGAVRAMELDINTQWVSANTYVPGPNGPVGTKLVDSLRYAPDRYLSPQSRDFVAVTALGPPPGR